MTLAKLKITLKKSLIGRKKTTLLLLML